MPKSFSLVYVGNATVDKRLSNPMIPWVIAQIRRGSCVQNVTVRVVEGRVVVSVDGTSEEWSHPLSSVSRLAMHTSDPVTLFYAVRHATDTQLLVCHLYQTPDPEQAMEVMSQMKEQSQRSSTTSNGPPPLCRAQSATALCPDISPSSSQVFEVLYIGKIKVSHKKVPESFIDDALDKFILHEKNRRQQDYSLTEVEDDENKETLVQKDSEVHENIPPAAAMGRKRSGSAGSVLPMKKAETLSLAATSMNNRNCSNEDNRTMVFYVGRSDLRLISPDRKQVLLHKHIKDIYTCSQGIKHGSHFAFVCKETGIEQPHYVSFVFKCQSPSVAGDVVTAITQSLGCGKKEVQKSVGNAVMSCEHCPLVWYHKLCHDLEAFCHDTSAQIDAVMRRVELLPEEEQVIVETKLQGATLGPSESKERLELLMMLLRAHCESKQSTHVHDTPQNRHEFINHYLNGGTIFMKAKRSLTNSFDQLLKRKGSRDDSGPLLKVLSLPPNSSFPKDDLPLAGNQNVTENLSSEESEEKSGPMKNIFMKVGHSPTSNSVNEFSFKSEEKFDTPDRPGSWRQAIFNTVVTPNKTAQEVVKKRDKYYWRSLWKKAINQQILLIRMEKENAQLTACQEEANVKRIKLEYDDFNCKDNGHVWDEIVKNLSTSTNKAFLMECLTQGIPRSKRGEIWMALINKSMDTEVVVDTKAFPNFNVPYEDLLKQLTSYQHAILIDLGRTFPGHKYFSSPLGPGQLALFNLLKAYSLLDPEVGYCQGLSFIAAVLLLHMSESESFHVLKQLMFVRGLRKRYLPDMSALQVHLYQLSRLLLDTYPPLYKHLDKYDVSPTLYAAPWLLTLFSSQFPLGFVTRVFDAMIVDSVEVIFKIAVTLMEEHKENLLACDSFELIMDYLKKELPRINKNSLDKIMQMSLKKDVSKQLYEYGVEYYVLQEEMSSPRPELKKLKQLESANQTLVSQNKALVEQLQIANSNISRLEASRSNHMAQLNQLESDMKNLNATVSLLGEFISSITFGDSDIEIPPNVLTVLNQLRRQAEAADSAASKLRLMRSAPLRVIEDNHPPASQSSNLSQKVSGLFRSNSTFSQNEKKFGRSLSEAENEGLLSRIRSHSTTENKQLKYPLKASKSSFELVSKTSEAQMHNSIISNNLPLDSNGVHVYFEGTTKLKSINPLRSRNSIASILPEDRKRLELQIIERDDKLNDKFRATMDKVTNLFESNQEQGNSSSENEISRNKEKFFFESTTIQKSQLI